MQALTAPARAASSSSALFVAHPGHELLIYGWLKQTKPRVFVLTDGSGHWAVARLSATERLLHSLDAPAGSIFGRLTDQHAYAAILRGDVDLLMDLARELASDLILSGVGRVVADAAEGYNPVHDLCRLIVGAACSLAEQEGTTVLHYEFAVVGAPNFGHDGAEEVTLDDQTLAEKLSIARAVLSLRKDVDEKVAKYGEGAFRHESFRIVGDWTASPEPSAGSWPYEYESIGEDRVRRKRYTQVIRHCDHMHPLQVELSKRVQRGLCVS